MSPRSEETVVWLSTLPAPLRVAYEACPAGYGLTRRQGSHARWRCRRRSRARPATASGPTAATRSGSRVCCGLGVSRGARRRAARGGGPLIWRAHMRTRLGTWRTPGIGSRSCSCGAGSPATRAPATPPPPRVARVVNPGGCSWKPAGITVGCCGQDAALERRHGQPTRCGAGRPKRTRAPPASAGARSSPLQASSPDTASQKPLTRREKRIHPWRTAG